MAIRKHGTGRILDEGADAPDSVSKTASTAWTEEDSRELAQENSDER